MLPELRPMDVIVIDGLWYMPHHWLIRWRGLDSGVHCITVKDSAGNSWSPEFLGITTRNLFTHYAGRTISIHRFKNPLAIAQVTNTIDAHVKSSKGYDFKAWLMGGILGLTCKSWVEGTDYWTCSELPYWGFQDVIAITPKEEVLPMPRLFRYNSLFETIYTGVVSS